MTRLFPPNRHKLRRSGPNATLALASAAFLIAGCGGSAGNGHATSGSSTGGDVIKIGMIAPYSGGTATLSQLNKQSASIAQKFANQSGGINGKEVRFIKADDKGTGSGAVKALRKLTGQGIHLVLGGDTTPECQALIPQLKRLDATLLTTGCLDDKFTGPDVNDRVFRTYQTVGVEAKAITQQLCKHFANVTRVDTAIPNYSYGETLRKDANQSLKKCGVSPSSVARVPLDAKSASAAVSKLLQQKGPHSKTNSLLNFSIYGSPLTSGVKLGTQQKLFSSYRATFTVSAQAYTAELSAFADIAPNMYLCVDYSIRDQSDLNTRFLKAYRAKYQGDPGAGVAEVFNSTQALFEAIRKAGSTDPGKVAHALEGLSFHGLQSHPITIDADTHQGHPRMYFQLFEGKTPKLLATIPYPKPSK